MISGVLDPCSLLSFISAHRDSYKTLNGLLVLLHVAVGAKSRVGKLPNLAPPLEHGNNGGLMACPCVRSLSTPENFPQLHSAVSTTISRLPPLWELLNISSNSNLQSRSAHFLGELEVRQRERAGRRPAEGSDQLGKQQDAGKDETICSVSSLAGPILVCTAGSRRRFCLIG